MTLRLQTPLHLHTIALWWSRFLIFLGLAGIGLYLWTEADRWLYERVHLEEVDVSPAPRVEAVPPLETSRHTPAASEPARVPTDPMIIGQIEIPELAVKAVVRRGIDATTLRRSVGHVPGTALPGDTGNAVLAGHRDTYFAALKKIKRGHLIRVRLRNGGPVDYRVDHLAVVGRDAVEVMETTPEARLTLVTCYPFDFIGPSPRRFIVGAAPSFIPPGSGQ